MKVKKGKYIRLTEKQLNTLVESKVKEQLNYLLEYAIPRSKFVDNTSNLVYQIIENWCLIRYCTLALQEQNKEHWATELRAHISNIGRDTIKGNDSYDSRIKAISEGFDSKDAFNGPERIMQIVKGKFKAEKITDTELIRQVILDCSSAIKEIVHHIANYPNEDIDEYIKKI